MAGPCNFLNLRKLLARAKAPRKGMVFLSMIGNVVSGLDNPDES